MTIGLGVGNHASADPSGDSDTLLQQMDGQVCATVFQLETALSCVDYFRFPTIHDLAASDIETVNSLWKGLGYYSRAARLLSGAQKVVKDLDGRLPDNAKDMQAEISGIGRYSAGAICSIAYNQCVPVVGLLCTFRFRVLTDGSQLDGNVIRLLTRFLALYAPPKAKQVQDILWAGAEAFVDGSSHSGDINQALIELGSTVCKVRDPVCGNCPLRAWCRAYQRTQSDSVREFLAFLFLCCPQTM